MLRIIAGKYKGLRIEQPDAKYTRPTTDKVREAVFSSLQFKLVGSTCLDLFGGSGAWSIEAISRGAGKVDTIEKNKIVAKVIQQNFAKTKQANEFNLIIQDALIYLDNTNQKYDFVFMDAPFIEYDLVSKCLEKLVSNNLLKEDFEIVLETNDFNNITLPDSLKVYKEKQYGKIGIYYLCQK
ncbi:16S rRNA (guanine(966)-N(2))-methyltransferase RsmD [Mycoplasma seminis]|uniref:16S rRNA (Guanine(966)-N(2))-methyltransferase RsmD n=1 Tax=Mycoplasma seminis TaxID=512749 RepID=A0ABY9H9N3_9MOLU|nr:16S rRNA (guanine(966)-N(2))-methyltransferase RsmD [Mycoplasma seminis]WLP85299.1 16S rRNA (guanine(966)-N(2))-methyltransferase RsmD [Mycoplasma seminis]